MSPLSRTTALSTLLLTLPKTLNAAAVRRGAFATIRQVENDESNSSVVADPSPTIDWAISITSPTRSVTLTSVAPSVTSPHSSPANTTTISHKSITFAAIVTAVILLIASITFMYRWTTRGYCCRRTRKKANLHFISNPIVPKDHLPDTSMDFHDGQLHDDKKYYQDAVADQRSAWHVFGLVDGSGMKPSASSNSAFTVEMERPTPVDNNSLRTLGGGIDRLVRIDGPVDRAHSQAYPLSSDPFAPSAIDRRATDYPRAFSGHGRV